MDKDHKVNPIHDYAALDAYTRKLMLLMHTVC